MYRCRLALAPLLLALLAILSPVLTAQEKKLDDVSQDDIRKVVQLCMDEKPDPAQKLAPLVDLQVKGLAFKPKNNEKGALTWNLTVKKPLADDEKMEAEKLVGELLQLAMSDKNPSPKKPQNGLLAEDDAKALITLLVVQFQAAADDAATAKAEEDRKKAEDDRKKAEDERKKDETARAKNEDDRKKAEDERKKDETARTKNEDDRKKGEDDRKKEEAARAKNEADRKKAEDDRAKAEDDRKKADEDRKKADEDRKKENEQLKLEVQKLAKALEDLKKPGNGQAPKPATGTATASPEVEALKLEVQNLHRILDEMRRQREEEQRKRELEQLKQDVQGLLNKAVEDLRRTVDKPGREKEIEELKQELQKLIKGVEDVKKSIDKVGSHPALSDDNPQKKEIEALKQEIKKLNGAFDFIKQALEKAKAAQQSQKSTTPAYQQYYYVPVYDPYYLPPISFVVPTAGANTAYAQGGTGSTASPAGTRGPRSGDGTIVANQTKGSRKAATAIPAARTVAGSALPSDSLLAHRDQAEARPAARRAEKLEPLKLEGLSEEDANLIFWRGYDFYWKKDYAEALRHLDAAIALAGRDARFWYYKGLAELARGDEVASQTSIARAVDLHRQARPAKEAIDLALARVQGAQRDLLSAALESKQAK